MRIAKDCFVSIQYRLTDESGQLLDSSPDGEPLVYLHGAAGILPALERELTGKVAGDRFDISITPDQGFGERQPALVETMPRSYLQNTEGLIIGGKVTRSDESGAESTYFVTAFDPETVTVDANHPFAGMMLRFEGVVLDVRQGTAEEIARF